MQPILLEHEQANQRTRDVVGQSVRSERLNHGALLHRVTHACVCPLLTERRFAVEAFVQDLAEHRGGRSAIPERRTVAAGTALEQDLPRHRPGARDTRPGRHHDAWLSGHHVHAAHGVLQIGQDALVAAGIAASFRGRCRHAVNLPPSAHDSHPDAHVITLFLIVFLDLIGFGMIIPVFPFYAEKVGVEPASVIFFLGLYSFGQLIGAPIWGAMSDRFGRRPVLLITLLANAAASWLLGLADTGLLLGLSRIVAGLAAGNISTAYAYATDVTTDATRPRALGLLGSAFGLGFIVGPALGGLLADSGNGDTMTGLSRVAHAAAALSVLAFVLTFFRLPESLPADKRRVATTPRQGMLSFLERPVLRDLLLSTMIVIAAVALLQTALAVWAAQELGIGPRTLGWIYVFIGVVSVAVQAGAIGSLTKRFGAERLTRAGAILIGLGMAGVPFVHSIPPLLVALAVFSIGSALFNPSMSGMVAGAADAHERGAVLGAYQGSASLGRVIGPLAGSAAAVGFSLNVPFLIGAGVSLLGALLIHAQHTGRKNAAA